MSGGQHWLNAERMRDYPRIFLGLFLLASLAYPFVLRGLVDPAGNPAGADFVTFWSAGTLAVRGRPEAAYDLAQLVLVQREIVPGLQGAFGFYYPPPFLLVVVPLGLLPYLAALVCFGLAGAAAFGATAWLAVRRREALLLILAFPGLWYCLVSGQNALITASLAGGAVMTLRRRPIVGGMLAGLLVMKPHLAVLFPLMFVVRRDWRALASALLSGAAFFGVSVAVLGAGVLRPWLAATRFAATATELGVLPLFKMPSTFAWLLSLGTPASVAYAAHAVVALAACWACWLAWKDGSTPLAGAATMTATFLLSPYAFDYDLAWLAFPIAWVGLDGIREGWHPGDREALALAWVLPILGSLLTRFLHIPASPLVLGLLLWTIVRRVRAAGRVGVVAGAEAA